MIRSLRWYGWAAIFIACYFVSGAAFSQVISCPDANAIDQPYASCASPQQQANAAGTLLWCSSSVNAGDPVTSCPGAVWKPSSYLQSYSWILTAQGWTRNSDYSAPVTIPAYSFRKPSCYLDAMQWKVQFTFPGAVIWWCDTPKGVEVNSRGWTSPEETRLPPVGADRDTLLALDSANTDRAVTDAELAIAVTLARRWEPHCMTQASGTATTVPVYSGTTAGKRGVQRRDTAAALVTIAPDVRGYCDVRLAGEATRYCAVDGKPSTKGAAIPSASYAKCALVPAPASGW